ncbi:MAG: immunoglobulin domain-containing protein [Verrucomicrobiota bacterium]
MSGFVQIYQLCFVLLFWIGSPLQAQVPANDSFASRLTIIGSTNTVTGDSRLATRESGEPDHAGHRAAASLWWTWTAPDTGVAIVDTSGSSFDTVLAVYTGTALENLTLITANDDAPGLATSIAAFPAVRGITYQIAVDGFAGASGDVTLNLRLPVTPTAPRFTSQPAGSTVPDNAGANVTFAVTVTGSFPIFFEWQKNGVRLSGGTNASFTITNATLDDAGDYRVIASNSSGSITSSVAVLTVLVRPGHDAFAQRIQISGEINAATSHNFGATTEEGEPIHAGVGSGASVWWSWTAPKSGLTRFDTSGSTNSSGGVLDTVLAIYTGLSVNSLTPVVSNNDEASGLATSSRLFFRATEGVTYQIAVAGLKDADGTVAVGNIQLNLVQAPDNDYFVNALEFPPGETTVYDNIAGATIEPGEPSHAGNPGGQSVWWSWVAPNDGTYVLDTQGSLVDTVLGVYTGATISSLMVVAEDDNRSHAGISLVKFFAVGGTIYHFVVDGHLATNDAAAGLVVLNLNPSFALNDDFAERTTLSGQTNQVTGSNLGASKELGEPNHAGNAGGHSIWWTWTAPITGPVLVTTRDSTFDTTLAIYTGTQLASLTLIAENDDRDVPAGDHASAVQFLGIAGKTYQIAVDGYRLSDGTVAVGTVVLSVFQRTPPQLGGNDLFVNRFPIVGQTNTVIGVNTNASREVGEPDHAGNDGGRSVWWSWVAPASTPVTIGTFESNFDTILAVYVGTRVDALTLVAEDKRSAGNGRSSVTFEAVAGTEYQIVVDGFNDGTGASSGRVILQVSQFPPGNLLAHDHFENASPILEPFLTVVGLNIGATRQPGEPAHGNTPQGRSVWWTWTAANEGPVTISTVNSQFDTILAVYTGTDVGSLSLVAENDDVDAGNLQSSVTFQAAAGTVYRIAVDGYANQIGLILLTVAPGANTPAAPQIQQDPVDQTRFAGGGGGGTDVTFRVLATGSLPMSYQWLRDGVNLAGATNEVLTLTNATSLDAGIYQVTVTNRFGIAMSTGAGLMWFDVPFNDDFASRILIVGSSNLVKGSILGAGKQPDEPHHGGEAGGRSVWWKWIAPSDGPVEMHTLGTSWDTLLAVYQGNDLGNLTLLTENNDLLIDRIYASKVLFNAVAGQEYQIAVDASKTNTTDGSLLLSVRQPPPPPVVLVHPPSLSTVHFTNSSFTLDVTGLGVGLLRYQWSFNGSIIANATNASYALGRLDRGRSGIYSVAITDDYGSVTSSNATVWVEIPQLLQTPRLLPNGRVQLFFSDPDGTLAADPSRFEVHHTDHLSGPATVWIIHTSGITRSNGRFLFEDQTSGTVPSRLYRVIER